MNKFYFVCKTRFSVCLSRGSISVMVLSTEYVWKRIGNIFYSSVFYLIFIMQCPHPHETINLWLTSFHDDDFWIICILNKVLKLNIITKKNRVHILLSYVLLSQNKNRVHILLSHVLDNVSFILLRMLRGLHDVKWRHHLYRKLVSNSGPT